MAPKGLYSVQKSRSFGGSNNFQNTPPKETPLSPEQGRKTPNFDSLRKKFSRKKTSSFDDDDGDSADNEDDIDPPESPSDCPALIFLVPVASETEEGEEA